VRKAQFAILFGERFTRATALTGSTGQAIHGMPDTEYI